MLFFNILKDIYVKIVLFVKVTKFAFLHVLEVYLENTLCALTSIKHYFVRHKVTQLYGTLNFKNLQRFPALTMEIRILSKH